MLPDVESRKMKSEGANFSQERIDDELGHRQATVGGQAVADQRKVAFEPLARRVRLGIGDLFTSTMEPDYDQLQQSAVQLGAGNPRLAREFVADPHTVVREQLAHRIGN